MNKGQVHELLNEAINLWVEISGVDPEQTRFRLGGSGICDLDLKRAHERLKKSLELDKTGFAAWLLLRGLIDSYQEAKEVSYDYIISNPEKFTQEIEKVKRLRGILEHPIIQEATQEFKDYVFEAAEHYDYDKTKIVKLFADRGEIGDCFYYALRAATELKRHQFSTGKYDKETPRFYNGILKFPDLHVAVQFANAHEGSLISLALIRDTVNDNYSYFCFLCKNGENIYILYDDTEWAHPLQKEMSRRPDRHIERHKAFADYLPYQLIEVFDNEEKDPDKKKGAMLSKIKDLPIYQALWLIVIFDKIHQDLWKNPKRLPELTYFAGQVGVTSDTKLLEGVREGDAEKDTKSKLPVPVRPVSLDKITKEELTAENMKDEWGREPTRQYEWLENRYRDKVPDIAINPDLKRLKAYEEEHLLTDGGERKEMKHAGDPDGKTYEGNSMAVSLWNWDKKMHGLLGYAVGDTINVDAIAHCRDLRVMDDKGFGTVATLKETQRWHARYNQANMIQYYAHLEYEERKDEICEWWQKSVEKQKDRLIELAVRGELMSSSVKYVQFGHERSDEQVNMVEWERGHFPSYFGGTSERAWLGKADFYKSKCYCPLTNAVATLFLHFVPKTMHGLAAILNCKVKDLPDVLQHWWQGEEYTGNSILDNIDPMEWVVKDPWKKLRFNVVIPISRRAFKKLRKEFGLPPVNFDEWPERSGW